MHALACGCPWCCSAWMELPCMLSRQVGLATRQARQTTSTGPPCLPPVCLQSAWRRRAPRRGWCGRLWAASSNTSSASVWGQAGRAPAATSRSQVRWGGGAVGRWGGGAVGRCLCVCACVRGCVRSCIVEEGIVEGGTVGLPVPRGYGLPDLCCCCAVLCRAVPCRPAGGCAGGERPHRAVLGARPRRRAGPAGGRHLPLPQVGRPHPPPRRSASVCACACVSGPRSGWLRGWLLWSECTFGLHSCPQRALPCVPSPRESLSALPALKLMPAHHATRCPPCHPSNHPQARCPRTAPLPASPWLWPWCRCSPESACAQTPP